jgi:hypothetical protein
MPLRGMELKEVGARAHLAGHPVLEALRQAIPDEVIDAVIAEAGAQEQRRRLLSAQLVVALVIALSLWTRENVRDVLRTARGGSAPGSR